MMKILHRMFTQQGLTFMYGSFKFNHVSETISPETATAASKMYISCSKYLLSCLCCSCLRGFLKSIFVIADRLLCGN